MSFSSRILDRVTSRSTAFTLVAASACAAAVFACGGISDPTKGGETVATVSGSLTGSSVPAGARVALVWRTASSSTDAGGYALGDDVPVVGGKFSISLAVPASAYFSELDSSTNFSSSSSGSVAVPPTTPANPPSGSSTSGSAGTSSSSSGGSSSGGSTSSSGGSSGMKAQISPKDMAGGSIVTQPLSAAVAGFVVYVDTNGNGKLDLSGQWATSTDTILGGASDLVLTYLKDGGALDYEKLRDGSGILPAAGFNLAWTEKARWLPLNEVELKLQANAQLPSPVCSTSGYYAGSGSSGSGGTLDPVATPSSPPSSSSSSSSGSSGTGTDDAGTAPGSGYPDPSDPNLKCAPDGRSFSYSYPSTPCTPPDPTPVPTGLCTGDIAIGISDGCATGGGYGSVLPSDGTIPEGWPCTVAKPPVDGGAIDGGSADGG